jgi:hypothetical protein
MTDLTFYYEGGTVDRHWLAPEGLGLVEAKRRRVGKLYKTREGARRALVEAEQEALRRANFERWMASGDSGMSDLDLRAAAQYAQAVGDYNAERQIDDRLAVRDA